MKNLLPLLLCVMVSGALYAQTNLIQTSQNVSVLNAGQTQRYNTLTQTSRFSLTQLVQFAPLTGSVNPNGNLQINLSSSQYQLECTELEFKPNTIRYVDEQNYYYYGSLMEGDTNYCDCRYGEIMLTAKNGRKYGYFTIDESKYEILAIDSDYSVIGKIDNDYFADKQECIALNQSEQRKNPDIPDIKTDDRTGTCVIRVLFLYTPAAEAEFGADVIEDMADMSISQTNQALFNSQIHDVCVARANVREWAFVENGDDILGDMGDLIGSNQVAGWRQSDLADVVCLITDGDYAAGARPILGLSGAIPDPLHPGEIITNLGNPMEDLAFIIAEANSLTANYTFSHELGHIMGCRHQTCATYLTGTCDDNGTFEHGHGWGEKTGWLCKWKNYSSLLHQLRPGNTRLLNYSNPNVEHNDHPTGIAEERDNARWITEGHGCTVAGYLPDPLLPAVEILGDEKLCRPFVETYFAAAFGSTPPYTYEWHISSNGVDWGAVAGTGVTLDINSNNYPLNSTVFLRVKVTTALGNSIYAFFQISIVSHGDCFGLRNSGVETGDLKIYPNPTEGSVHIAFNVENDNTPVSVSVFSVAGALLNEDNSILHAGAYNLTLPTNEIVSGPFILQVRIGETIQHQLMIKR